ncbi:MAG TPA: hypothetical protein VIK89_03150 [Cytophagaceae bacterium]
MPVENKIDNTDVNPNSVWTLKEKTAFRIAFIYVALLLIPNPEVLNYVKNIDWLHLNCRDLFIIATWRHLDYVHIATESGRWGLLSYINLFIPLLIAIPSALIWGYFDKDRKEYNKLYYWISVLVRYKVGIGIVAWGYRKLVPGQMVWPTVGIMNTPFGDFQAQKLYWQAVGIVPEYEVFLGLAEFVAGFLLLFRKTTALGAALTAVVLGNIVIANHVYDGSVHVHSFYYTLLAIFLLWKYLPSITRLLIGRQDVAPAIYYPQFNEKWQRYTRTGIKLFLHYVFVGLFFALQVIDYIYDPYRIPETKGLPKSEGYYEVTEFKYNNQLMPYSPLDSLRWHDAIFESWSTLSFKVNRPAVMDQSNGGGYSELDIERSWELAGIGGGRRFFYYEADTVNQILKLQNKNAAHRDETMILHYSRPNDTRIILSGINEFKDSVHIVLDKVDKHYAMLNGPYRKLALYNKD